MTSGVGNRTTQQSYQPLIRQVTVNNHYIIHEKSKHLKHEIIIIDNL